MPEPLVSWIQRLANDEHAFDTAIGAHSILVYDPPEDPNTEDTNGGHRFRTASGIRPAVINGDEPLAVLLTKSKDNVMQRRVTVGRTSNNDVVLADASVSRFHAWFQQDEKTLEWSLVDAGSKNGTWLDGERLPAKKPLLIRDGQTLKVGGLELTFYSPSGFKKMLVGRGRVA